MKSYFSNKKSIAVLVIPGIAIMLFAISIPLIISLYLSLFRWTGFGPMHFLGGTNYARIVQDRTFWRSLLNVCMLIVVTIGIQNVFAFYIASLVKGLSSNFSQIMRTVFFIPATLSLVVVTRLWVNIYHPTFGMLNGIIRQLGFPDFEVAWLGNPDTAIWSVIWIMIWQGFGWALLFLYGGLMTVPKELEEAALVDGVNRFQMQRYVVLPCMLPVIQAVVIIGIISSFKQMEMVMLSTEGGPGGTTQFLSHYLYLRAFKFGEFGYGNAISVIVVLLSVSVTVLVQRIFRRHLEHF